MPSQRRAFLAWLRTSTSGSILVLGVVALVVLGAIWAVGFARQPASSVGLQEGDLGVAASAVEVPETDGAGVEVGAAAPSFSAVGADGTLVDLDQLRGRPVWLVFNATWCANCRAELPDIQKMQDEAGDDIEIVGVYLSDSAQKVSDYADRLGLSFSQVADPGSEIGALYQVFGVPSHYFIDAEGKIAAQAVGVLGPSEMRDQIEALISRESTPSAEG